MAQVRVPWTVWLAALLLAGVQGRADEPRRAPAPQDPDAGFLEFLGSVDRLAEVNPNYLAQVKVAQATKPPPKSAARPPPPPNPGVSGAKNND
jgi:hypothetical protein